MFEYWEKTEMSEYWKLKTEMFEFWNLEIEMPKYKKMKYLNIGN
jgi:hypothetical protein